MEETGFAIFFLFFSIRSDVASCMRELWKENLHLLYSLLFLEMQFFLKIFCLGVLFEYASCLILDIGITFLF